MRISSRSSQPTCLSESARRSLSTYAIAASAAGVSLLAMAFPAEAKIVYVADNQHIFPNSTVPLDLNGDGKIDFNFHVSFTCTSFCEYKEGELTVIPAEGGNEVWGQAAGRYRYASALSAGVVIGPGSKFASGVAVMARGGYDAGTNSVGLCLGPWKNEQHRYLGLKFAIDGQIHYGWARLDETCKKNGSNRATLTGYAYETIAYKPISAGKISGPEDASGKGNPGRGAFFAKPKTKTKNSPPVSLGVLALGARGLQLWRRDETDGVE